MSAKFESAFQSVSNHNERAVYTAVAAAAPGYAGLGGDRELLADVACVALNRLAPRYIRHEVDFSFYQTEEERGTAQRLLTDAVSFAFAYVQARTAAKAAPRATG